MQYEAVLETEGAVLVLAGAGTGKTKVLTARLAHIIDSGVCRLSEIMAVTFTNKAASEMKSRAFSILQESGNYTNSYYDTWIGTFHSLSLKMIRPHHDKIGLLDNFSIIDSDDQIRIIKKIMQEESIDDKKYTPRAMAYYINRWKDQLKGPEEARKLSKKFTNEEKAAYIYRIYSDNIQSLNAIDFGDILMKCVDLFRFNPEVLSEFQQKFHYIMVDEYQDTNTAQYVWLKMLSLGYGNICCVGDDDQSIYGWRGADIENILKFEQDFKNAKVIRLEQNYRSTGNILSTANAIISGNSSRLKKNLWTEGTNGLPVIVKCVADPYEEAFFIGSLITNKNQNGMSYSDIAILVRASFQTRVFEDRFLALGIPYNIVGGMRFYERKEVKDAVSYLRFVNNPDDGISFERIINVPKRGIGPTTINKFYEISREYNLSLPKAALMFLESSGQGSSGSKLRSFFDIVEKWREYAKDYTPSELMKTILTESGYIGMLRSRKTIEDDGKIETLEELVTALEEFEDLPTFLDYVGLVLDKKDSNNFDRVTISTIHAAKGLEYGTVFIPGFEENIFPHAKAIQEKGENGVEEECRLCYVAVTRAKKELYITFCNRRNVGSSNYGHWQMVTPSRFLKKLPKLSVKIL